MSEPLTLGSVGARRAKSRFVGRRTELEKFRISLDKTLKIPANPSEQDILYPHIFLIVGLGGMGKTWLTREFTEMARLKSVPAVYLDAEHHRVADEDGLMRTLHDEVVDVLGDGAKKPLQIYHDAVTEREKVRRKVEEARTEYEAVVGAGAKLLTGGLPSVVAPLAEEFTKKTIHGGASLLAGAEDKFMDWIRKRRKLDDDEFDLAINPYAVTEKFMLGLNGAAGGKPLLIVLDTYELLDEHDAWMRHALTLSGSYLLWVIAGREDDDFLRRYRDKFAEEFLAEMRIHGFARNDIADYLRSQEVLPDDSSAQEALIDTVQGISQGVPLAVEALVNLRKQGVNIAELFDDMPNQQLARREVVETLTTRFLKWCDASETTDETEQARRKADKHWIEGLALLGRYDRSALLALGQKMLPDNPPDPDALLEELHDRYSFIFGNEENEMHDLVRQVLREHLQQEPPTYWLERFAEAAVGYYTQEMVKLEAELGSDRADVVTDKAWQEAALGLLNTNYWADRHGRIGSNLLNQLAIEAQFFTRNFFLLLSGFLSQCLDLAGEFTKVDASRKANYERWKVVAKGRFWSFSNLSEGAVTLCDDLRANAKRYQLSPMQEAIVWLNWGDILRVQGKYTEALDAYQRVEKTLIPLPATLAKSLGEGLTDVVPELIDMGRDGKPLPLVVQAAKRATELVPNNADARYSYGVALEAMKQYPDAIDALKEAIHLEYEFIAAYLRLALVFHKQKQYEQAIAACRKAIDLDPDENSLYLVLGAVYHDQKHYEQAITAYQKAIDLDPDDEFPYNGLAFVYRIQGRNEEAVNVLERAVALDSPTAITYCSLASSYRQIGNSQAMQLNLIHARELIKEDDYYNRACLESIAGNVEEALQHLEKALALMSDRNWAQQDPDFEFIRDDPRFRKLVGLE